MNANAYTGPTGVTSQGDNLHINGYPTAKRLAKITSKPAQQLAALRSHQTDLDFCRSIIPFITAAEDGSDLRNALLIAFIVRFCGVFRSSGARSSLKAPKVFKEHKGALEVYRYYDTIRDKHIVHDENGLHQSTTCAVLGEGDAIIDVMSLSTTAYPDLSQHVQLFNQLVTVTTDYLEGEVKRCIEVIFAELKSMPSAALAKMSQVTVQMPPNEDLHLTRKY